MTDRQQNGVWFTITGVLLLSLGSLSYAIVNWATSFGTIMADVKGFSGEQLYILGAAGVLALQLASLTGLPFLITGLAQIIIGTKKSKTRK